MSAILRKAKADIASRPLISLLIVITVAASSMLLTLALATLMNLSAPYDRVFEDLNGAHVWLYLDRSLVGRRDIERIEMLPQVTASTGLRHYVTTRAELRGDEVPVALRALPQAGSDVNQLLIREGRQPSPHEDELLVSTDLADVYKLSVEETLGVTGSGGKTVDLPVVGLAYNPTWDTYRSDQPPYVYVSEETLASLYPERSQWGWTIGLRLTRPDAVDHFVTQVESLLHDDVVESHTDWRDVKDSAVFGARMNVIFLGAFGIFAILSTVLVVASSVGSIVLSQFRQIGILKTVGFTSRQIVWLYVGEYLMLGFIGTALGLGAGIILSPLPLRSVAVSLNTTFRPALNGSLILLVMIGVPAVVVSATLGAAYRGARANIIKSIAVGAEAPEKTATWGVDLAARLGLPMVLAMGINDVAAKPFRALMTCFNLTLGVIGIAFGLTLNQTLATYRSRPALLGLVHDAMVTRRAISDGKARHLLNRAGEIEAYYSEAVLDVETQAGYAFNVRAVEGDLDAFPFRIEEGRFFHPDTHEAVAGRGLLDWLEIDVGDEVTVTFDGHERRPVTWKIVGQYPEPTNEGEMLMVSLPIARRCAREVEPDTYFLKLVDDRRIDGLKRYLKDNSGDDLNLTLTRQAIPDDVFYLQMAIFALAAILIGIALINVFNTSLLAMQEKTRDIGILKTLGMTPGQVVAMVNASAGFLGLVAALVGVPVGYALTRGLLASLSQTYGFGTVHVALNGLHIGLLVPSAVAVSIAGSLVPGRRAAQLSIVRVLRGE